jgi:hypothetical protein
LLGGTAQHGDDCWDDNMQDKAANAKTLMHCTIL